MAINTLDDSTMTRLTRYRDAMARRLVRRSHGAIPIEEFQSAGNLGITLGWLSWTPSLGYTCWQHCRMHLLGHMLTVWKREAVVRASDARWNIPARAAHTGFLRCYVEDVFRLAERHCTPRDQRILQALCAEELGLIAAWEDAMVLDGDDTANALAIRLHYLRKRLARLAARDR